MAIPAQQGAPLLGSLWSGAPISLAKTPSELYCRLKLLFNPPSFPLFLHRCQTSLLRVLLPLSFILRAFSLINLCIPNSILASASRKMQNDTSKPQLLSSHVLVVGHEKGSRLLPPGSPLPLQIFLKQCNLAFLVSLILLSTSHPGGTNPESNSRQRILAHFRCVVLWSVCVWVWGVQIVII